MMAEIDWSALVERVLTEAVKRELSEARKQVAALEAFRRGVLARCKDGTCVYRATSPEEFAEKEGWGAVHWAIVLAERARETERGGS